MLGLAEAEAEATKHGKEARRASSYAEVWPWGMRYLTWGSCWVHGRGKNEHQPLVLVAKELAIAGLLRSIHVY